ncbi:malonyl-CoA synthase [Candidatus Puniceispirillum sp.]|nr:malonyl-CoA synthase [Candidatus Puniceispirillum sp.]
MSNLLFDRLFKCHEGETKSFLIFADGSEQSYDNFLKKTARFANVIQSLGLVVGDRLAAQIEKSPEALALYAACVQSGIIFLPLNKAYTPNEVSYFVGDSGAKLIVADENFNLEDIAHEHGALLESLNTDGSGSFVEYSQNASEKFETVTRAADDLVAFLYTSGTTGRSKGAMLTHKNLLSNAETLVNEWEFDEHDVLLHALPIFHTHGLFVATNTILLAKGSMIFLQDFSTDMVIHSLPKASTMMGVPTFYTRLLDDPRLTSDLTSHMRLFISGSAPLLAETHIQFESRTGHRILERYGMTETNMNTSNPYHGERRAGTVGRALPGVDIKITNPNTGKKLADGEIGQIEVRGPNVFVGYWNMPGKTREELRENGFFITGDLGLIDDLGYLQIVGRNKDLIISGGYNIYPKEIELLLDDQPGILESAVIGAPHPDFGESVIGVIVADGSQPIDLDVIEGALGKNLARFKRPRKLFVVDSLPRNTMGKVQKNMIRDLFGSTFQG